MEGFFHHHFQNLPLNLSWIRSLPSSCLCKSIPPPPCVRLPSQDLSSALMASSCSSSAFLSATQSSLSGDSYSSTRCAADPFSSSLRVKVCDVFLGFCGRSAPLLRFVKWLRAELEAQGVRCVVSDRRLCGDAFEHCAARAAIDGAAVGVVVITSKSFSNPYSVEDIRCFLERKRLLPVFFGLVQGDCTARDIVERRGNVWERAGGRLWTAYGGTESEWKEAVNGVTCCPVKLEVNTSNFRDRILDAVYLLGKKLGRRSMVENVKRWREMAVKELPFPRNADFVGRKRELAKLKQILFGDAESNPEDYVEIRPCGRHRIRNIDIDMTSRTVKGRVAKCQDASSSEKKPVAWKELEDEIEMQGDWNSEWPVSRRRKRSPPNLSFRKGVACVCGDSGIGKTELLLEFAYMFAQNYKMVLWVGGELKYFRQNYLNLLPLLGVDLNVESETCSNSTRDGPRSFEEMEADTIGKVRRELMRGIPYLLVIDNLESEKDWWDGRNIMELLPRFGGEAHIIISSCLPEILNIRPLRLSYLSAAEAMMLMNGRKTDVPMEDVSSLRLIEEKLGRIPLGLAIVRAILLELSISPRKLLDSIDQMPYRELKLARKDYILNHNPGLVQLLDLCFSIIDSAQKPSELARKMVEVSNLFAPSPIPISMLAIAASASSTRYCCTKFWNRCIRIFPCISGESDISISGDEVSSQLLRLSIARNSTIKGYICFHQIVKLYAYERDNGGSAISVFKAIENEANLQLHANHIWAACFLFFKFGREPWVTYLPTRDLLYFIRCFVLPLALLTFSKFSHCIAALELLRASTEALESLEECFLSEVTNAQNKTLCFKSLRTQSSIDHDRLLYHHLANLRAILLETRAKFMLQGGEYVIGEHLCRTAISIKEVIFGHEHPQTQATRRTMERLVRLQACSSRNIMGSRLL